MSEQPKRRGGARIVGGSAITGIALTRRRSLNSPKGVAKFRSQLKNDFGDFRKSIKDTLNLKKHSFNYRTIEKIKGINREVIKIPTKAKMHQVKLQLIVDFFQKARRNRNFSKQKLLALALGGGALAASGLSSRFKER